MARYIIDQITGREPTLEEQLYQFVGPVLMDEDEPELHRLRKSFKGRFDDSHFIPERYQESFSVSQFIFTAGYCRLDVAFGDKFRDCVDRLTEILKGKNDEIIKDVYEAGQTERERQEISGAKILSNKNAEDLGGFYYGPEEEPENIEKLRKEGLEDVNVKIGYRKNDIGDTVCFVYAGGTLLFGYFITPKSELEKEVRLNPGYEQRTYKIEGTTEQLDTLEKAFTYLQLLGESGHSSGITIRYDGDGNARMGFEREDGKPLSFPAKHLQFSKRFGKEKQSLTAQEFLRLLEEHKSLSWKGERISYDFRDDEESNRDVGHFFIE